MCVCFKFISEHKLSTEVTRQVNAQQVVQWRQTNTKVVMLIISNGFKFDLAVIDRTKSLFVVE